jgi:molecular chaperone GrpE
VQNDEQENSMDESSGEEENIENFQDINMDQEGEGQEENEGTGPASGDLKADKLEKELSEQRDKYLRLVAEFDNYRKRISRERVELMQTANTDFIVSLLDILDDCDRASEQMENTDDTDIIKEGALLIFGKLKNQLQARGLKEMITLHEDFDPELHDAIAEVPAPSEDLKGKVIDNIQKGYYLKDKLIRHAKVIVGK